MNKFQIAKLSDRLIFQFSNFQITKIIFGLIFVLFAGILPITASAATLYLDPATAVIGPDDVVEVRVKIGVGSNECINAAQIGLDFPSDILEVKDFNSGESFFSLWVQRPDKDSLLAVNQEGKIVFSGGTPGGYCGKIPGDPGDSNILGSVIFTPKKPILFQQAKIDFSSDTQAFLNDGQGTEAALSTQGAVLEIDEKIKEKKDDWAAKIAADDIPPQPFTIEIDNDPKIAEGRYFVVFSTTDKETGVDHYEILETKAGELEEKPSSAWDKFIKKIFMIKQPLPPTWNKAVSPYILKDQSLSSTIKVKAVDRAGNERIVEYSNESLAAPKPAKLWSSPLVIIVATSLFVVILVMVLVLVYRKKKIKDETDLSQKQN